MHYNYAISGLVVKLSYLFLIPLVNLALHNKWYFFPSEVINVTKIWTIVLHSNTDCRNKPLNNVKVWNKMIIFFSHGFSSIKIIFYPL